MGKFKYVALNGHGKLTKGTLEAPSIPGALQSLREQGLWPLRCFDPSTSIWHRELSFGGPKVPVRHFTVFCRQLATLYQAGVNMVDALKVLGEQAGHKPFQKVIFRIADELKRGSQFSVAAAAYPTVFNAVFINMIRAGETSGNLDEMLLRLADFHEKEHNTREKIKSAMVFPAIMGVLVILVIMGMMIFIIPQYVNNFERMGLELPMPTKIVIAVSNFAVQFWYLVIVALFIPSLLSVVIRRLPRGSFFLDTVKLKLPVFGELWQKQAIARFSRVFSSLYGAAIPMMQTLTIVSEVSGNEVLRRVVLQSKDQVRAGHSIAEPYKHWVFPPMVAQMLSVGEQTGSLDTMMSKVADFYEADVEQLSERLKSALEPIMTILLAGIVGVVVLAVMMPTFQLFENL